MSWDFVKYILAFLFLLWLLDKLVELADDAFHSWKTPKRKQKRKK